MRQGTALTAYSYRKGAYHKHDLVDLPGGHASFHHEAGGRRVARRDVREKRAVQQRDAEALGPLNDHPPSLVDMLVQKGRDRLDSCPFAENLRIADEAKAALSKQPPAQGRPGPGSGAANGFRKGLFGVDVRL